MDSWGRSHEVEKPKPFNERAAKCAHEMNTLRRGFQQIHGKTELTATMLDAEKLLLEAVERGVKGKDVER